MFFSYKTNDYTKPVRLAFLLWATLQISGCAMLSGFSDDNASGYRRFEREECVPYARSESGINIRGDAWTWWNAAAGRYQRGSTPAPGAILVLTKTNRLRSGHLAVVKDVLGPRDIDVTHTNWGDDWVSRRIVYESMHAQDVSPGNDWTSVRFWNRDHNVFGSPYTAKGFIYNQPENTPLKIAAPATPPPLAGPMDMPKITYAPPPAVMPAATPPPVPTSAPRIVKMAPIVE
jgi:hypothetical protein